MASGLSALDGRIGLELDALADRCVHDQHVAAPKKDQSDIRSTIAAQGGFAAPR